jgi:hypothetical protein
MDASVIVAVMVADERQVAARDDLEGLAVSGEATARPWRDCAPDGAA